MKTAVRIFGCIVLIITVIGITTYGWAMTHDELRKALQEQDLDKVVVSALAEGMTPEEIVRVAVSIEGLNPQAVLVALCKAGVDDETIIKAGKSNKIASMIIQSACLECKKWAQAQPYTPAVAIAAPIPGSLAGGSFGFSEPYASKSTF